MCFHCCLQMFCQVSLSTVKTTLIKCKYEAFYIKWEHLFEIIHFYIQTCECNRNNQK